jgi:Caspase domain
MRIAFLACFLSYCFIGTSQAAPEKRVALVIGQNAYANFNSLDNSVPDARTMAALLAKNGFEVISCDGKEACFDLSRGGLVIVRASTV